MKTKEKIIAGKKILAFLPKDHAISWDVKEYLLREIPANTETTLSDFSTKLPVVLRIGKKSRVRFESNSSNKVLILLEDGAELKWLAEYTSKKAQADSYIFVGAGAKFEKVCFIRSTNFYGTSETTLLGKGASGEEKHICVAGKQAKIRYMTKINHLTPKTKSAVNFNIVLQDGAQVKSSVLTTINKEGVDAEARQNMKSLLFGRNSESVLLPYFAIKNNRVTCSHAVSSGHVDEAELFYMRSRGVRKAHASKMLALGFLEKNLPEARQWREKIIQLF